MFFTPDKPISELSLLVGRDGLIASLNRELALSGKHVFLFGPKGIGKTSVVSCLSAAKFDRATYQTATQTTTFGSLFREILNDLQVKPEVRFEASRGTRVSLRDLFVRDAKSSVTTETFHADVSDPNEVRRYLHTIEGNVLIVIDNLEKVDNHRRRAELFEALANLSKLLTDSAANHTYKIVLVGTAYDIASFIPRHHSINRIYRCHDVAPVSVGDLAHLLLVAEAAGRIQFEPAIIRHFAELSLGYPFFVQAIGSRIEEQLRSFEPEDAEQLWQEIEAPPLHVDWQIFIAALRFVCEEQVLFYRQMYGMMTTRRQSKENRLVYCLADHIIDSNRSSSSVAMPVDAFFPLLAAELRISAEQARRLCSEMNRKGQYIFISSDRIGFIEPVLIPFLRASLEYQRRKWQRPMLDHPELPLPLPCPSNR